MTQVGIPPVMAFIYLLSAMVISCGPVQYTPNTYKSGALLVRTHNYSSHDLAGLQMMSISDLHPNLDHFF